MKKITANKKPIRKSKVAIIAPMALTSAILILAPSLFAAEYSLDLGANLTRTDNVFKRSTNEESDLKRTVQAGLFYANKTKLIDANFNYDASFETYDKDSFDDKTYLNGNATINLTFIPNVFSWTLLQSQRTQTINNFDPETPENTDERSTFQTGPTLSFSPSKVDKVSITGLYIDTSYDTSDFQDSERTQAQLSWSHQTSAIGSITLKGNVSDVEFTNNGMEYDQDYYGIELYRRLKLGSASIEFGRDKIDRGNGVTIDGNSFNVALDLEFVSSNFGLRYVKQLTDTSNGLGLNSRINGSIIDQFDSGDANLSVVDFVERKTLQAFYTIKSRSGKSSFTLGVISSDEDYKTSDADETQDSAYVNYRYKFSESWSSLFRARYSEVDRDQDEALGKNKTKNYSLFMTYKYSPQFRIEIGAELDQRSNTGNLGRDYDELTGIIGFNYTIGNKGG